MTDVVALCDIFNLSDLTFSYDDVSEQIIFSNDKFTYFSKAINSNYPPYEKIIPLDFTTKITLDREDLVKNLHKASIFTKASNNTAKLAIADDQLVLTAASPGDGNFQSQQELLKKEGEDLEISFNIRYLLDFLSTSESDAITIGCNGPSAPTMIKDPQNLAVQYVVMPFKPKG